MLAGKLGKLTRTDYRGRDALFADAMDDSERLYELAGEIGLTCGEPHSRLVGTVMMELTGNDIGDEILKRASSLSSLQLSQDAGMDPPLRLRAEAVHYAVVEAAQSPAMFGTKIPEARFALEGVAAVTKLANQDATVLPALVDDYINNVYRG